MNLAAEVIDNISVITVPGETLDAGSAKEFKAAMAPFLTSGARLVLDLSQSVFARQRGTAPAYPGRSASSP